MTHQDKISDKYNKENHVTEVIFLLLERKFNRLTFLNYKNLHRIKIPL